MKNIKNRRDAIISCRAIIYCIGVYHDVKQKKYSTFTGGNPKNRI